MLFLCDKSHYSYVFERILKIRGHMIDHEHGPAPTFTHERHSILHQLTEVAKQSGHAIVGITVSLVQGTKDNFRSETTLFNPRNW